jgi:hypothetical protein
MRHLPACCKPATDAPRLDIRRRHLPTSPKVRWNNRRPHPRFRALMEQMQFTADDAHGIL